jgi:AraC-like DNA-binding protein
VGLRADEVQVRAQWVGGELGLRVPWGGEVDVAEWMAVDTLEQVDRSPATGAKHRQMAAIWPVLVPWGDHIDNAFRPMNRTRLSRVPRDRPLPARPTRRRVDDGHVRFGPLMAIPAVLADFGIDAALLMEELQLDHSTFEDPEHTVEYGTVGRIFDWCQRATRCEHFGLMIGERAGLSSLGPVGYLAQSAPNVAVALQIIGEQLHVTDRGGIATVERDGDYVTFGYAIVAPSVVCRNQILAAAIAIGFNILRSLCGPRWSATAVHFACAGPLQQGRYRQFFQVTPLFNQTHSGILFPARWLAEPPPSADPVLHQMMRERIDELLAESPDGAEDVVSRAERALRVLVMKPYCSIDLASMQLGLSVRTLKRRLADAGTTFLELREQVRFETACQLLRDSQVSINEVAHALGYSESSSFTRAFKRWAGVGPAEWRRHPRP